MAKDYKGEYAQKLRDPRWQRKRLEVMQRDKFTCQYCGDIHSTLNVHHLAYHGDPWDTPNDLLITCCEQCHEYESDRKFFESALLLTLKRLRYTAGDVNVLANCFHAMPPREFDYNHRNDALSCIIFLLHNKEARDRATAICNEILDKKMLEMTSEKGDNNV